MSQFLPQYLGKRVQVPVFYDAWMRGMRYGVVTCIRRGKPGFSDVAYVKPDVAPERRVKVWRGDWEHMEVL